MAPVRTLKLAHVLPPCVQSSCMLSVCELPSCSERPARAPTAMLGGRPPLALLSLVFFPAGFVSLTNDDEAQAAGFGPVPRHSASCTRGAQGPSRMPVSQPCKPWKCMSSMVMMLASPQGGWLTYMWSCSPGFRRSLRVAGLYEKAESCRGGVALVAAAAAAAAAAAVPVCTAAAAAAVPLAAHVEALLAAAAAAAAAAAVAALAVVPRDRVLTAPPRTTTLAGHA